VRARPQSFKGTRRSPLPDAGPTPAELAYWETRVLRQRYTAAARPGSENELFARIEHDGQWVYFPLESEVPQKAAARACEVYRALSDEGWLVVRQRYVRQIVWAIYWFTEPLACTYTTLFSVLAPKRAPAKARAGNTVPVALVEPDPEVQRGLKQCLDATPGYTVMQTAALAKDLLRQPVPPACTPRLVLFNQHSLDLAVTAFQQQLQERWPGVIAVPFGVFGHSDELFIGVTGMDRGYFLRRRLPTGMLEPLKVFWKTQPSDPAQLRLHLQPYFQNLITADSSTGSAARSGTEALSYREIEILRQLGAGHTDKTIASLLAISVWTVHAHVKSLFEKLGVHTRAEAVMRYLQK
jgi:DNA-binding NarL/FixJ family response regulator